VRHRPGGLLLPRAGSSVRGSEADLRHVPDPLGCLELRPDHDERFGVWGVCRRRSAMEIRRTSTVSRCVSPPRARHPRLRAASSVELPASN